MSEEIKNENLEKPENATPATETNTDVSATDSTVEQAPAQESPTETVTKPTQETEPSTTQPQIIVQKERGFSHYVGFALLCVLCICFFFMPGIALTFGVSRLVSLNGAAAWIFSAILSFIIWLIFKLKIKGFKKSFYFYIGLCVVVLALLIAIEVLTEKLNVFASIFALLTGAA